jgi:hypothetical protein
MNFKLKNSGTYVRVDHPLNGEPTKPSALQRRAFSR